MLPDTRMSNVYDDIIWCEEPLPNLNFAYNFFTLGLGLNHQDREYVFPAIWYLK